MKKRSAKQKVKSLKMKLMLSFMVLVTIIMTALGAITISGLSENVGQLNDELTAQVVSARAAEFGMYMHDLENEAKIWSERNVLTSGDFGAIKSDLITRQQNLRTDLEMMFYADKTGAAVTSLDTEISVADRAYFDEIINGGKENAVSNPVESKATGKTVFVIADAVKNSEGETVGLFGTTVTLDMFNDIIKEIKIGEKGRPWIIDNTGLMIAHPDEKERMVLSVQNSVENGYKGLDEIGEKMLAGEEGIGQYVDSSGEKIFATYAPIPNTPGWAIAYSMTETDMMGPVNGMTMLVIIVVAISLLVVGIVTYFLSRGIVKPVKAAADLAKALASGELDKTVKIQSNDEVGQLAKILDNEVRTAFKDIEQARIVTEKQAAYQAGEVGKLLVNLQRLARGELFCDIVVDKADQDTEALYQLFSEIASDLSDGVNAIKDYINEISDVLGEMANGNMCVSISSDYKGDFITLKQSINMIAESLNSTLTEINSAAVQVAAGTIQVSSGSQTISQGATEQASSIEELSASITQIAAQTKQNAVNANKANELAMSVQTEATDGNDHMEEMQAAMSQINESSQSISKIIKVIDDIAFQTNILALNAAVEAARAGIHGKGFAVVAEEVRNLAARSASAAKETTELIEGSIRKVEVGTRIADQTAAALSGIVSSVEKAAGIVAMIAAASNEQATGIAQVDRGIEQMSQVVQTNSATAQETAAASEELSSQADLLKSMVNQFTLLEAEIKDPEASKTTPALKQEISAMAISLSDNDYGKY